MQTQSEPLLSPRVEESERRDEKIAEEIHLGVMNAGLALTGEYLAQYFQPGED